MVAKRVEKFKLLDSTVNSDGRSEEEVRRLQAGWRSCKVSGIVDDKNLSAKVKHAMYQSVMRPAMLYGTETAAMTKKQVRKMEGAEL